MHLRLARFDDLPEIRALIAESARELSRGFYSPQQVESLLRYMLGPDTQLIADGTYYVFEAEGTIAAAGGWGRRRTLHGGDQTKQGADPLLDPAHEPARIRAFFVHPTFARQGLGRRLFERCLADARAAGFSDLTLIATLAGEPLYRAVGFELVRRLELTLPDGVSVPASEMLRPVSDLVPARV